MFRSKGECCRQMQITVQRLRQDTVHSYVSQYGDSETFKDAMMGVHIVGYVIARSYFYEINAVDTSITIHLWDGINVVLLVIWRDAVPTYGHLAVLGNLLVIYRPNALPITRATNVRFPYQLVVMLGTTHIEAVDVIG